MRLALLAIAVQAAVIAPHNPDVVTVPPRSTTTSSNTLHIPTPTPTPSLDCNGPQYQPNRTCWKVLNMTGYLQDWIDANQTECDTRGYADFASCYQNLNGVHGQNCTSISSFSCDAPDAASVGNPHVFYTLWNIYTISVYFNNFWHAIDNARSITSLKIPGLVSVFDPKEQHVSPFGDFMLVLSSIFCFARVPGFIKLPWLQDFMADSLFAGLSFAPTAARFIWPDPGTIDSQWQEFGDVSGNFANATTLYQRNMTLALNEINSNVTVFNAFAGSGVFCENRNFDMQTLSDYLNKIFYTYISSRLMIGNQIYITSSQGINPCTDNNGDAITIPANGICGDNYWDNSTQTAYTMTSQRDMLKNWTSQMTTMLGETTGPLLFGNAANCNGGNGGDIQISAVTPDALNSTTGLACVSSVQVCPFNQANYSTEYTNSACKQHSKFAVPNCKGGQNDKLVPAGYFGKWIDSVDGVCFHEA